MDNRSSPQILWVRSVSTTTQLFDGRAEKCEVFEDLFGTTIKMQPDMTKIMKINRFEWALLKHAVETCRNINPTNKQTLEDILANSRHKHCEYIKPESQVTAKHK